MKTTEIICGLEFLKVQYSKGLDPTIEYLVHALRLGDELLSIECEPRDGFSYIDKCYYNYFCKCYFKNQTIESVGDTKEAAVFKLLTKVKQICELSNWKMRVETEQNDYAIGVINNIIKQ